MFYHHKSWINTFESICRDIHQKDIIKDNDPEKVYFTGLRLLFSRIFREFTQDNSQKNKIYRIFSDENTEIVLSNNPSILNDIELPEFVEIAFPGVIYGELLGFIPKLNDGNFVLKGSGNRRVHGAYYTPPAVVNYIVFHSIGLILEDIALEDLEKIKICDPAMGTGRFLIGAAEKLTSKIIVFNDKEWDRDKVYKKVVANSIYGIDKDPIAASISAAYFYITSGFEDKCIENFVIADTLLDKIPFKDEFDIVLGNPPWQTFGLRNIDKISKDTNDLLRQKYPETAEYKISIYALFIQKAIELTRDFGVHSFIVPDSWLSGKYFSKLRNYILNNTSIHELGLIDRDFWKGLNIGRSTVYIMRKDKHHSSDHFRSFVVETPEELRMPNRTYTDIDLKRIRSRERSRIVIYPDKRSRDIVEKMESSSSKLGDYIRFYSGLIGKKGKDSIVIKDVKHDSCNTERSMLIESGRNLERDKLMFKGFYIMNDPALYKSGYNVEKYKGPKMFLNQTGYELKAFYDDTGLFCLNNIHIGYTLNNTYDIRFIVSLMNSKIMNYYYKIMSMEYGRALAQTDIDFLEELPMGNNKDILKEITSTLLKHQTKGYEVHSHDNIEYWTKLPKKYVNHIEELFCQWYGLDIRVKDLN